MNRKLPREFYTRSNVVTVARELLGKLLVVVTNASDFPHAVLIRAVEPVEGIELMRKRRRGQSDHNLSNGSGKLCIPMGIDRKLDAADLLGDRLWLEDERIPRSQIAFATYRN